MDGPVEIDRSAIERAARNMGVVPGDAAYPFLQAMLQMHDRASAETAAHIAAMKTFTAAAEKTSNRPLLTPHQLHNDVLPTLVSTIKAKVMLGAVGAVVGALVIGFVLGFGVHRRITPPPPELTCWDERGGRVCFAWTKPPTEPLEPQQPQQPQQQPATTATPQQPAVAPAKPAPTNGRR